MTTLNPPGQPGQPGVFTCLFINTTQKSRELKGSVDTHIHIHTVYNIITAQTKQAKGSEEREKSKQDKQERNSRNKRGFQDNRDDANTRASSDTVWSTLGKSKLQWKHVERR